MDDCLKPISKMIYADAGQCCGIGADDYRLEQNRRLMMLCNVCRCSGTSAITAGTMPPGSVKDLRVGVSEKKVRRLLGDTGWDELRSC
jgi:hypothetical protein